MFAARPFLLVPLVLASALSVHAAAAAGELQERLRTRLEQGLVSDSLTVAGEPLYAREALRVLYADRDFAPLWVTTDGLTASGAALAESLARAPERQGLSPRDYHEDAVARLRASHETGADVDVELALTDAFLTFGQHLLTGRLDPTTLDPEWSGSRRPEHDLAPYVARAAASSAPGRVLEELLPRAKGYSALVEDLAALRRQRDAGGWPTVPAGPTLREGDAGARVERLAQRLAASGDLSSSEPARDTFDADLVAAVKRFQSRHGLGPDGAVGAATLRELNVPIERRIDQIIVNLERWRWLPEDLGERYVIVNIAGFELDAVEHGEKRLSMRVVVGTPYRRTPVFSGRITYIVLNPSWEVPPTIAVKDKLPLIKANPHYLAQQHFVLLRGWGADERVIDPATVDWSRTGARNFPYRLRQSPGPDNALGRIKFMFPNPFSVYLHDTPSRELFAKNTRSFSSGCIRVERPSALAAYLLQDAGWDRAAIEQAIDKGVERTVLLKSPMPVHLLYWTAWVDENGELQLRDDLYGRDARVLRALRAVPQ